MNYVSFNFAEAAAVLGQHSTDQTRIEKVIIDSRQAAAGSLFLPCRVPKPTGTILLMLSWKPVVMLLSNVAGDRIDGLLQSMTRLLPFKNWLKLILRRLGYLW